MNGYKIRKAIDELQITHYWLESPSGEIIDLTAEQYTNLGRPLPYDRRVVRGVSPLKSNHAKAIISNVQHKLGNESNSSERAVAMNEGSNTD